ncbi:MAG: GNAT family N-acetyltransferase [Candidatus Nanopelagicales bacterium]
MTNADTLTLRPAQPQDTRDILAMIVELAVYEREPDAVHATEADLTEALFGSTPVASALVAEVDGSVAGFALWFTTFSPWEGRAGMWLEDLFVRPEFRQAGVGLALLSELAQECLRRGFSRLEWWVLDWNSLAIGFYDALGAESMDEWTRRRLSGSTIAALAASQSRE